MGGEKKRRRRRRMLDKRWCNFQFLKNGKREYLGYHRSSSPDRRVGEMW
jgi:hypothetical protein